MTLRWPTSRSKTLAELEDRIGELVGQLEPVVLPNQVVETTEKAFAHGLGEVPGWVGWDPPHCIAVVRQTRPPDKNCVYLRATARCAINIRVLRAGPLGFGEMRNGGYHLADWDPAGTALGDHKVATDATDEAADGADYLLAKHSNGGNVAFELDASGGLRRVKGQYSPGMGTATDVSGWVTVPDGVTQARLALSIPVLQGIKTTGRSDGENILLHVTNAAPGAVKQIVPNAAAVPADFAPLRLQAIAGSEGAMGIDGPSDLFFRLDTGINMWRMYAPPIPYVVP